MQHALGDRVQGNWPAIIYPAAAIAAAGLTGAALAAALCTGAGARRWASRCWPMLQASLAVAPLPVRFDPIALRLAGWDTLAARWTRHGSRRARASSRRISMAWRRNLRTNCLPGVPVVGDRAALGVVRPAARADRRAGWRSGPQCPARQRRRSRAMVGHDRNRPDSTAERLGRDRDVPAVSGHRRWRRHRRCGVA